MNESSRYFLRFCPNPRELQASTLDSGFLLVGPVSPEGWDADQAFRGPPANLPHRLWLSGSHVLSGKISLLLTQVRRDIISQRYVWGKGA